MTALALTEQDAPSEQELKAHPLADLLPTISDTDLTALAEDIAANGLNHPIVMHDGMILDGRHRYRACRQVGVTPRFREFDGVSPARSLRDLRRGSVAENVTEVVISLYDHGRRTQRLRAVDGPGATV